MWIVFLKDFKYEGGTIQTSNKPYWLRRAGVMTKVREREYAQSHSIDTVEVNQFVLILPGGSENDLYREADQEDKPIVTSFIGNNIIKLSK